MSNLASIDVDVTAATETGVGAGDVFVLGRSYNVEMDIALMNTGVSDITAVTSTSQCFSDHSTIFNDFSWWNCS